MDFLSAFVDSVTSFVTGQFWPKNIYKQQPAIYRNTATTRQPRSKEQPQGKRQLPTYRVNPPLKFHAHNQDVDAPAKLFQQPLESFEEGDSPTRAEPLQYTRTRPRIKPESEVQEATGTRGELSDPVSEGLHLSSTSQSLR